MSAPSSPRPTDDLEALYRSQIKSMMTEESQKRIDRHVDPKEDKRLMDLDIIQLVSLIISEQQIEYQLRVLSDLNQDLEIDILDIVYLVDTILNY